MLVTLCAETGFGSSPLGAFGFGTAQLPDKEAGDIGGRAWVRYEDEGEKGFKLHVERQNGRAAMLGITGCLLHELLGVDALYPTGGYDGASPPRDHRPGHRLRQIPRLHHRL